MISKIRKHIVKNEFIKALKEASKLYPSNKNDFVLLESRLDRNAKGLSKGVLSNDEYNTELNRISYSILEIVTNDSREVIIPIEKEFKNHQYNLTSRLIRTKNFLERDEKVQFIDCFYPLTITHNSKSLQFKKIIEQLNSHSITFIEGKAGSGKSFLLKRLTIELLNENQEVFLFQLSNFNELDIAFLDFINCNTFFSRYGGSIVSYERGAYIILDGFDELTEDKSKEVKRELEKIIAGNYEHKIILSSRPGSIFMSSDFITLYKLKPFDNKEKIKFIESQIDEKSLQKKIIDVINTERVFFGNSHENYFLSSIAGISETPLFLAFLILIIKAHKKLPKNKFEYYQYVFDILYSDSERVLKSEFNKNSKKTSKKEITQILSEMAVIFFRERNFNFSRIQIENLISSKDFRIDSFPKLLFELSTSIGIINKVGLTYSFLHRSFMHFFISWYLKELPKKKKSKEFFEIFNENNLGFFYDEKSFLYSLLLEADKIDLIKYFALPFLYNCKCDSDNEIDLVEHFFKIYDFYIGFDVEHDQENNPFIEWSASYTIKKNEPILSTLFKFHQIDKKANDWFLTNEERIYFTQTLKEEISFNYIWQQEKGRQLILKLNFPNYFKKLNQAIDSTISELENALS